MAVKNKTEVLQKPCPTYAVSLCADVHITMDGAQTRNMSAMGPHLDLMSLR